MNASTGRTPRTMTEAFGNHAILSIDKDHRSSRLLVLAGLVAVAAVIAAYI